MSEPERNKLEEEAEKCLKQCESTITQLQAKISQQTSSSDASQLLDHRSRVLLHLWDIYAEVSSAYFEQKSARLEISLEERMGYTTRHQAVLEARRAASRPMMMMHEPSPSSTKSSSDIPTSDPRRAGEHSPSQPPAPPSKSGNSPFFGSEPRRLSDYDDDGGAYAQDHRGMSADNLGALDARMQEQLKRENVALQSSLSNTSDEIRQMEQQIVIISQAQQIIAHNLMQQRDDLEHIHKQTKDATTHIAKGNDELEKAAQSSSKFRIFLLIFLLTLSFLLLLLHRIEP